MNITAVVNTHNEAANITRCLRSVHPHVDEIVVVDMESTDDTRILAKKFTSRIFKHPHTGYVEPARNFAIDKAKSEWVFLIDADEEVPGDLGISLRRLIMQDYTYFRIPRKNIIFGKWVKHTGWWPDYQIRLFRKDAVTWSNEIHSIPVTLGKGTDLPVDESMAIIHHNYQTVEQFIDRLNRYTSLEAKEQASQNVIFDWKNFLIKPSNEFFSRYFTWEGYKDGWHGMALSLLQAISLFIVQLKIWQHYKFPQSADSNELILDDFKSVGQSIGANFAYWYHNTKQESSEGITKALHKIRSKIKI